MREEKCTQKIRESFKIKIKILKIEEFGISVKSLPRAHVVSLTTVLGFLIARVISTGVKYLKCLLAGSYYRIPKTFIPNSEKLFSQKNFSENLFRFPRNFFYNNLNRFPENKKDFRN